MNALINRILVCCYDTITLAISSPAPPEAAQ